MEKSRLFFQRRITFPTLETYDESVKDGRLFAFFYVISMLEKNQLENFANFLSAGHGADYELK